MATNQKNSADTQLSKMKKDILPDDNYVFKRTSCEDQFKFNIKLSTKLRDAENTVKIRDAETATVRISEGLDVGSDCTSS